MDIHDDRGKGPGFLRRLGPDVKEQSSKHIGKTERLRKHTPAPGPSPRVGRAWCGALVSRRDTNLTLAAE